LEVKNDEMTSGAKTEYILYSKNFKKLHLYCSVSAGDENSQRISKQKGTKYQYEGNEILPHKNLREELVGSDVYKSYTVHERQTIIKREMK
jgi:hypothetical protein